MPFPETILKQFRSVNHSTTDESEYYGPYTSLLTDLFPHDENFQVVPQLKGPTFLDTLDFTIIFVVMKQKVSVFFIEIKPYDDLQSNIRRGDADEQMRRRFRNLLGSLPTPKLYGASAMGTRLSIYEYTKATGILLPPAIARDLIVVNKCCPSRASEI